MAEGAGPHAEPRMRLLRALHDQLRRRGAAWRRARVPHGRAAAEDERRRRRLAGSHTGEFGVPHGRRTQMGVAAADDGAEEPKHGHREDRRGPALRVRGRREAWLGLPASEEPELSKEEGGSVALIGFTLICVLLRGDGTFAWINRCFESDLLHLSVHNLLPLSLNANDRSSCLHDSLETHHPHGRYRTQLLLLGCCYHSTVIVTNLIDLLIK